MKLAKKVLSVVLAVAIALGAFAVAASANGNPDTAEYQAKIWLTGAVSDIYWSSKTSLKQNLGDESDPGATIEAQPGDEILVRIYITNNYYVHTIQSNLFYSSGLLDAGEIYQADAKVAPTEARRNKMQVFNTDNYFNELHAGKTGSSNCWSMQMADANQKVDENWPTDDAGNELFDHDDWKWNRFFIYATSGVGETCILEDEENCIISMPLRIPADAAPGTTYTITIPEGIQQRSAKIYGATRISEIGIADGESEPCDYVDAAAQLTPNMQYADENQYIDYSEATLKVVIPGEAGVDTAALEAKIAEATALLDDGITADSATALGEAILAGNTALKSDNQDTINAAVTTLTNAIAEVEYLANFDALNAQILRYDGLNADDYDATSWAAATQAYEAATAIDQTNEADQDAVDAAAADLKDALDNLAPALDYSALEAKYNELANKDVANYTDETAGRFNAALAAAKALIDNKNAADQNEINAAYNELVAANAALDEKAADYTALDKAIADFEDLTAKDWTSASYADAKVAYDAAKAVARNLKISAQATVTAAADELNAKIAALVPATGANYADLDAAIAAAKALVEDHYTTDSWAAIATALANAENVARDLTSEEQATIDEAAAALNKAIADKVEADADYSAVNTAITAANAILNKKDEGVNSYDDATLAAINAAIADVTYGLKKKDQTVVDGYAAAINAAIANAEFRPYDYSAINAHIAAIEANAEDYYDAASYANYVAKKNALVWTYTHENYAQAKLQQIQFLKVTVAAAAAADYSAVTAAKDAFTAKKAAATYTDDSIAAVEAEIAKVVYGLNANHQAEVDAYAAAINAAIDKMEEVVIEPADYTVLDKAIADAKALDSSKYVSFGAVIDALYDAQNVARDLTVNDQAIIDRAAKALNDAMATLEEKADYTALDAALAEAAALNKNAWTADSWADLEKAVAAGKAISRNLGVTSQTTINDAAAAITAAIADLDAKEVTSSITEITYVKSEDTHNTFDVTVDGRAAMVQFIEMDGGTRTYDRYNKNVTIKSYNAADEEVNSLDRSVVREVWTINTNLIGPDVKVHAKYLNGNQYIWETEKYAFTLEFINPTFDAEIRDILPEATSGKKGSVVTTVVVGPDAEGIKFVMDNGTTTTYTADKATVLENGDLEFTGKAWANHDGDNTIVIKVKVNGAWVEKGVFTYTVG